jgi:predicted RNase H-like HicB family nuclease
MTYQVMLKHDPEEGYAVWCPGLPGCWSQGETEQQALENIRAAIHDYVLAQAEMQRDADTSIRSVDVDIDLGRRVA